MPEKRTKPTKPEDDADDPGKLFEADGRKRKDVSRVGGLAPDTDAEAEPAPRGDRKR